MKLIYKASKNMIKKQTLLTFALGLGKIKSSADIFLRPIYLRHSITSGAHVGFL